MHKLDIARIEYIAFDADDTLWEFETNYRKAAQWFGWLLGPHVDPDQAQEALYKAVVANLSIMGYGTKTVTITMIEVAEQLLGSHFGGRIAKAILVKCRELLRTPIELFESVRPVLETLGASYKLLLLTKGDNFDQMRKIQQSGLRDYFDKVHVMVDKTRAHYAEIFRQWHIHPTHVLMVGNSLRSDVLPLIDLGAQAVHVPFHVTWDHEMVSPQEAAHSTHLTIESLEQLPTLLRWPSSLPQ